MSLYQNKFPPQSLTPGEAAFLFGVVGSVAIAGTGTPGLSRAASGTVTCTTSAAHNFVVGQTVRIFGSASVAFPGLTDASAIYGFDGEFTILTVPSTTTFTYYDPNSPVDTGGGGQAQSVQAEVVTSGVKSAQVALGPNITQPGAGIVVVLQFTAAPTSGSVTIQEATDDVDGDYVTPGGAAYTIALGAALVYESDLIPFGSRFARLNVVTGPGAGNIVAKVLRVQ